VVVKRTHKAENVAPAIRICRDQINGMYPRRDKSSDGIWPSAAHTLQNPNSDHEAGNALDIDDDLSGIDGKAPQVDGEFARRLSMHPANNYVIHDSGIYRDGVRYPYQGSNPHTGHVHISVMESRRGDTSPWDIGQEEVMLPLDYLTVTVTDIGDTTRRAWLKSAAKSLGDLETREGTNTFAVDASRGKDGKKGKADVFIDYAVSQGLDCFTISTYAGQAAEMKQRNVGTSVTDAECAAQLAKAHETLGKIAVLATEGKGTA